MKQEFSTLDIGVFIGYVVFVVGFGLYKSRTKKGEEKNSRDYFLAGNTLPWWAIGTSLIAANISAEQLIGMTGSGFKMGLAIATYEWMAAATLIIVGKFFVPIFLQKKIYTMPEFLNVRYDERVRTILAIFWLFLYVFVNLTSIIHLGGLAIEQVIGVNYYYAIYAIAFFSAIYTISGGLMAIAWTDFIQVGFLVAGGLITCYLALDFISDGQGFFTGLAMLKEKAPHMFDMILEETHHSYKDLPGISVIIGGMWIINLNYWGCNQYITQRALAAKSLAEAQKGIMFAGYLKIFMPMIVVIPGIAVFVLHPELAQPDGAYPYLLNKFLVPGVRGVAFAALVAAIVGSLSSKTNSIATIFTMDLYKSYLNKSASEKSLVLMGRITTVVALVVAILVAPTLKNFDQAFQFIQEFTGLVSPGIFVIFFFGLFWKKANTKAALWVAILTLPISGGLAFFAEHIPFIDRMGIVFLLLSILMVMVSLNVNKGKERDDKAINITPELFKTNKTFNIGAMGIFIILIILYYIFW
ncbi:MAG: sodium/glucose cotransporter [Cytophagales bacterium]|nr:MAG: sodium/glucose cotransporter [Cytophagales bacterium]